jgi:biotin carboxylase
MVDHIGQELTLVANRVGPLAHRQNHPRMVPRLGLRRYSARVAPPETRLAVVLDVGSANPFEIATAARGLATPVFVCDARSEYVQKTLPAIQAVWEVCDITGCDDEEAARRLAAHEPAGIATFSEYQLGRTARLALACGLPFHTPGVVDLLTDKSAQRERLASSGVQQTRSALLRGVEDLAPAAARVGFPAVVKPRQGAGSRDTTRVDDEAELRLAVGAPLAAGQQFVLEELLVGSPDGRDPRWGDYVSVESVNTADAVHHVCVTGKFALSPPFRETGMMLPAPLSEPLAQQALDLTGRALRALGVRHGVTHTELKLTADGPRIIEINGRVGGYVGEILQRATRFSLAAAAVRDALGLPVEIPELALDGVTYQYFLAPPQGRWSLQDLGDVEPLRQLPGVRRVEIRAEAGQLLDSALGTESLLGVVYGKAADFDELERIVDEIRRRFQPRYAPVDTAAVSLA